MYESYKVVLSPSWAVVQCVYVFSVCHPVVSGTDRYLCLQVILWSVVQIGTCAFN